MNHPPREAILKGIAAYDHERKAMLRLLRKRGGAFTSREFDEWLRRPDRMFRVRARHFTPDSFIIGDGTRWGEWLEVLQWMCFLKEVRTSSVDGMIVYELVGGSQ